MDPEYLVQKLIELKIATADNIKGASEEEIVQVERQFSRNLPVEYRVFLRTVGRGAGTFWDDLIYTVDKLVEINEEFQDDVLLHRADGYHLEIPEAAFAIADFRGENTIFIDLEDANAKVPIYDLNNCTCECKKVNESLWDRVCSTLRKYEEMIRRESASKSKARKRKMGEIRIRMEDLGWEPWE